MTTAPDLPLAGSDVAVAPLRRPAPATLPPAYPAETLPLDHPARGPRLALVPDAVESTGEVLEDAAAFDDALRRAMPRLRRYASRRLLDQHEAEEVVQEALLRAFQHREQLTTEDDLMAWLTVVTGRLTIDRLRVRGRTTPVAELPQSRAGRDTADVVVARDEARIALDALEAMPGRQASVLWAREVEGLSYDEIGERYDLSEPTVRSLLHRARRTLRREYADRGGTLPSLGLVVLAPWLRGMRVAGRVRDIARRGTSAAAVAATGLVITTVAPMLGHQAAPPAAPATIHIYTAKAQQLAVTRVARQAATRPAARPVQHTVTPTTIKHSGGMTPYKIKPVACDAAVRVNCTRPEKSTLYVVAPGGQAVGVAANDIDCASLPVNTNTPLTHCEPSQRTNP